MSVPVDSEIENIMVREQMINDAIRLDAIIVQAIAHAENMLQVLEAQSCSHAAIAHDKTALVLECAGLVEEAWQMASGLRMIGGKSEGAVRTRASELSMKIGTVASRLEIFLGEGHVSRYEGTLLRGANCLTVIDNLALTAMCSFTTAQLGQHAQPTMSALGGAGRRESDQEFDLRSLSSISAHSLSPKKKSANRVDVDEESSSSKQ